MSHQALRATLSRGQVGTDERTSMKCLHSMDINYEHATKIKVITVQ